MLLRRYNRWIHAPSKKDKLISPSWGALLMALASVVMFSATVPLTKSLIGSFSLEFIASFRIFIAGSLAFMVVRLCKWPFPKRSECFWLLLSGSGVVIGFPFLLTQSLNSLSASEMGVVLAGMPLFTALCATVFMQERHPVRFWFYSILGAGILLMYFFDGLKTSEWTLGTIGILFSTVLSAGLGYAAGAKASHTLGGWRTICWTLVLYLPISSILFIYYSTVKKPLLIETTLLNINGILLLAILYLALVSQWYGFKFWYQAMTKFGAGKIAQLQLLMPFSTLFLAHVLLGETLSFSQTGYALAIAACIFLTLRSK